MKKPILILIMLLVCMVQMTNVRAVAAATVPINVTVNGALVLTDAANDTMLGVNPTLNVNLSVTPDLGQTAVTGGANFRIRTNRNTWRLTAQRTATVDSGTGLIDSDVSVTIAKSAGSTGNANAGNLVAPFTSSTTLMSIPIASTVDVISGTAKTSSAKDGSNTNNYFQVNTSYGVNPDFFFTPGTFSTTITYNLVSP